MSGFVRLLSVGHMVGVLLLLSVSATEGQESKPFLLGPPDATGPAVVEMSFILNDVNRIDLEHQVFEVEGTLVARWLDGRQAFDTLEAGVSEKIYQGDYQFSELAEGWWPQLVIMNAAGPHVRQAQLLRQRSDGTMTYVEELNATVEIPVNLHRFPFERQRFDIVFEVLGFAADELTLAAWPGGTGMSDVGVRVVGWDLTNVEARSGTARSRHDIDGVEEVSTFTVSLDVVRRPGFMIRVVIFPMVLLVALSWSVFWMDRESLGDRMSISFLGILSVVGYQLTVSNALPKINYFTLLSAFIYVSFVTTCASVLVNLRVGRLDRAGRTSAGDRVDRVCRWAFPAGYVTALVITTAYFLLRY